MVEEAIEAYGDGRPLILANDERKVTFNFYLLLCFILKLSGTYKVIMVPLQTGFMGVLCNVPCGNVLKFIISQFFVSQLISLIEI